MILQNFFKKVAQEAVSLAEHVVATTEKALDYFTGTLGRHGAVTPDGPGPAVATHAGPSKVQSVYKAKDQKFSTTTAGSPVQPCPNANSKVKTLSSTAQEAADPKGLLSKYSPTGSSNGGVAKSIAIASRETKYLATYAKSFEKVGKEYDIPPAILAGIASRETDFGTSSALDGWKSATPGNAGYGLMQIDLSRHPNASTDEPDGLINIRAAAQILR